MQKQGNGIRQDRELERVLAETGHASRTRTPSDFCSWGLAQLSEHILLDKALWVRRSVAGEMQGLTGFNLDAEEWAQEYHRIADTDPVAEYFFSANGDTIFRWNAETLPAESGELIDWMKRWDVYRVMVFAVNLPLGAMQAIGVYRGPGEPMFTETEGAKFHQLTKALFRGLRESREQDIKKGWFRSWTDSNCVATVTESGVVVDMENRFAEGLFQQWPDWQGISLPAELETLLNGENRSWLLRNQETVIRCLPAGADRLLVMTNLGRLAELTPRQYQVAELYAEGLSTKQIASQLDLRVVTVENHRKNIYATLEIGSNHELTQEFVPLQSALRELRSDYARR